MPALFTELIGYEAAWKIQKPAENRKRHPLGEAEFSLFQAHPNCKIFARNIFGHALLPDKVLTAE